MNTIGLSTLYLQLFKEPFQRVIDEIRKEDGPKPELWEVVDSGEHTLHRERIKVLKDLVSMGYRFTVHAPYEPWINIAEPEKERRSRSILRLKASIDAAVELEAKVWVFHPGSFQKGADLQPYVKSNIDSIAVLYDYAKSVGIRAALENASPGGSALFCAPKDFEELYAETRIYLPIVFDVAHAYLGRLHEEFISKLTNRFVELHLHDTHGAHDEHLELGAGTIEWRKLLSMLIDRGFNGIYMIETVQKPFESLLFLKKLLR